MNRPLRTLKVSLTRLAVCASLSLLAITPAFSDIFVSPTGSDTAAGTKDAPLATLQQAQKTARVAKKPVTIQLHGGTYYLSDTLMLTPEDSGVTWQAVEGETPVISGGVKLDLTWQPYKDGIMMAKVPSGLVTEELFANGDKQILARYPNFVPDVRYNGLASDAVSAERADLWTDPAGGYFHALHTHGWGGYSWMITGKDPKGGVTMEGGWQNNRPEYTGHGQGFVENIFEELDSPGEWFLNRKTATLYFYPPAGLDLAKATIEVSRLKTLVNFHGSEQTPIHNVTFQGITFRHAARTFMLTKESLLRSDWAIGRVGAIYFEGAVDCAIKDSLIDRVGGNGIFVNDYNRRITIEGCEMVGLGANGVVFLGDYNAVRSPVFSFQNKQNLAGMDRTPGPKTNNYPADCLVDDCLIHSIGMIEKQVAAVDIDISQNITVRHCSIYDTSRAGINIGDGCWGGDIVEYCDVFDTVKETNDNGCFNSWGRDRYWHLIDFDYWHLTPAQTADAQMKELPFIDTVKPNILRNNRWRCDHGFDIDLDDGSTNYEIYNNLCLKTGIKLREGFNRKVTNNVCVNSTVSCHKWYPESGDIIMHNILMIPYRPKLMYYKVWGKELDYNFFTHEADLKAENAAGRDLNSISGNPDFVDPAKGDFQVKPDSPALKIGFKNFPMDQFGVQKPSLKAKARTPVIPAINTKQKAVEPKDTDV